MEKHLAAFILRQNGATYAEIMAVLGIGSDKTLTSWARKHRWEERLIEQQLFAETASEQVREMIQYQLKILNTIKDRKRETLGDLDKAELTDLNAALISKGDIDALQKLFTTIRGKEITWDMQVKTIREFTEYLEMENHQLAKELSEFANDFLDKKRRSA